MKMVSTMSTLGFVVDSPETALAAHFEYYFAAKHSQSFVFKKPNSFEWTLMKFDGDPEKLSSELTKELESHFKELFSTVQVKITYKGIDSERDGKLTFSIAVMVRDNGKVYQLNRSLISSNKTFIISNRVL